MTALRDPVTLHRGQLSPGRPADMPPPRIAPAKLEELDEQGRAVLDVMAGGSTLNIVRTLAHNPQVSLPFLELNRVLLFECGLPMRLREIAVLRLGLTSRCDYEWFQHLKIGTRIGLTERDFTAIQAGRPAADWSELDGLMLETVNELEASNTLSDDLWARLSRHFDKRQMLELLTILGAYKMSAWIFNAVGVQLES